MGGISTTNCFGTTLRYGEMLKVTKTLGIVKSKKKKILCQTFQTTYLEHDRLTKPSLKFKPIAN